MFRDLVRVFFAGEPVKGRINSEQRGVQRTLSPVMRVQIEGVAGNFRSGRKGKPRPQSRRNKRCAGSLAKAEEKLTTGQVDRFERFARAAQSDVPCGVTCEPKLTLVLRVVKADCAAGRAQVLRVLT